MLDAAFNRRHARESGNPPTVSVAICAYTLKRWQVLVGAVESIREQTVEPIEIVLVIDHNPRLAERAMREIPGVRVLDNDSIQGLSGARNTAVRAAKGEIIAFLDDDARADPEWLASLLPCYRDPDVIGVGGPVRPEWPERRPAWFPAEFEWVVGCSYRGVPAQAATVRNLIGANMSLRRDHVAAAGGFNVTLGRLGASGAGTEETELCIRMVQRWPNSRIQWIPDARVHHMVPADRATLRYFVKRCRGEGVSKANVVGLIGSKGTEAERSYMTRTLPQGVVRAVFDAISQRRLAVLLRAMAIGAGLAVTLVGYAEGRARRTLAGRRRRGCSRSWG
jgi:cellulose synthase/poly-beta-1,6-N-acetylglucosamine synthase-like glycosyltransferase